MRANIQELAEIFEVSRPTVVSWIDAGMPYAVAGSKAKPWVFDVKPCIDWWAENKFARSRSVTPIDGREPYEEAERREKIAKADKAELELAKAANLVVLIEDVTTLIAEMHVRVRTRLLSISNQVRVQARSFFGDDRAAEEQIVSTVERIVRDAMTEIRDDPFADDSAGGGMEDEFGDVAASTLATETDR
jgi:phage terminase Nu1 subunit (DNA packaging protein)